MISEIGISYRHQSLSQNASLGNFPNHAPKPGDRLPFIRYADGSHKEQNIQDKMHGKFFCFFIFSETVSGELTKWLERCKDLFSIEMIPFSEGTKILYDKFGIKNNGCYLIRPDMYIAYRAQKFDTEHLNRYLLQFLRDEEKV
jgi:hypothetical protein